LRIAAMLPKNLEAWEVMESDFPEEDSLQDKLKFLLRYAILAPSGPNSQPWNFAIRDSTVSFAPI
jgi:nitroreductase